MPELTKKKVYLVIGEYWASREPTVIGTLLGSCVGVCLFDPFLRMGGMNHILLPGKADMCVFDDVARYGVNAMELLINRILGLGGARSRLVAKVFGGAQVLPALSRGGMKMGEANVAFVFDFLEKEDIPVINSDVGGRDPRKIYFHTDTNEVFLRKIHSQIHYREEKRRASLLKKTVSEAGEITLFDWPRPGEEN